MIEIGTDEKKKLNSRKNVSIKIPAKELTYSSIHLAMNKMHRTLDDVYFSNVKW